MPLPKLALAPEKTSYSVATGQAVAVQAVAGGLSRNRLDQLGAPLTINVQWLASVGEFAYLGAFYRTQIAHGSAPFLIDLISGYSVPSEHTANFVPGSFTLAGVSGLGHQCQAQLEVVTLDRDPVFDMALVNGRAAAVGGLPVMALTPSLDGYAVQRGPSVLRSQPGFGPSAFRLDRFNTASRMTVGWNVGPADFDYLMAFYYTAIAEGALPFRIESVLDHPDPRQLKAKLVPGSFGLGSIKGMTFSVRADIDVQPVTSPDYDSGVLTAYDAFGEDWVADLGLLERLVNVDMPEWD